MGHVLNSGGWHAGLLGAALALLAGCAQTMPVAPDCGAAVVPEPQALRLLLSFHAPVDADAPETLAALQHHAQACVRHVATVSPSVHAYVFTGVTDATTLRQRLLQWPALRDAVPDARVRAH